jgi:hypothetical protein
MDAITKSSRRAAFCYAVRRCERRSFSFRVVVSLVRAAPSIWAAGAERSVGANGWALRPHASACPVAFPHLVSKESLAREQEGKSDEEDDEEDEVVWILWHSANSDQIWPACGVGSETLCSPCWSR